MALDSAGIATVVDRSGPAPIGRADEVLAWVVREGATNVLRHSGASSCRIEVADREGRIAVVISDDGVGVPRPPGQRLGGLDGLRDRLAAIGGELSWETVTDGFRLVATVPEGAG
jgi:two-component system sensor histidine kinase DesK